MGRVHVDRLVGFDLHPAAEDATARKSDSVVTDDGQFKRAIEWRGSYGLPLHRKSKRRRKAECFDLDQSLYYIFNLLFCQGCRQQREGTVNVSHCKSLRSEFALLPSAWERACSGSGLLRLLFQRALQRLGPPSTSSVLRAETVLLLWLRLLRRFLLLP